MARTPTDETKRIEALDRLAVMGTAPDADLNDIAWLAAYTCGVPFAQINFVHSHRVWTKANIGFPETEVRRSVSPCSLVVSAADIVMIPDTYADERVNLSPLVVQGPRVRFYAGVPLTSQQGHVVGTLCVSDTQPRTLSETQQVALWSLSRQAQTLLGLRRHSDGSDSTPVREDEVQRKVREYNERMRRLVEQMPAAMWATDDKLRVTMTLGGALDDIHLRASQVVGKTLFEVFETDDPAFPPIAAHLKAADGKDPGALRWSGWGTTLEVRIIPLLDDRGSVIGTLGIGVDVTQRVKMDRAMDKVEDTFRALVEAASKAVSIDGHDVEELQSRLHTEIQEAAVEAGLGDNVAPLFEGTQRATA